MSHRVQKLTAGNKARNKWFVAAACLAAATANSSFAFDASAHGSDLEAADKKSGASEEATKKPAGEAVAEPAEAAPEGESEEHADGEEREADEHHGKHEHGEHEHGEHGEHEEKRWVLGLDMVTGFGKTDVITQDLPGTLATNPTTSRAPARMLTESFLLSAGYELCHNFGVGLRLPFTFGQFSQPGRQDRGTSALGNLELEGEYEHHLNHHMKLIFVLGVALPTAQGDELPEAEAAGKLPFGSDLNAFDRFGVNHSAAASRGFEENALFEPKRLGIIPKVILEAKHRKLTSQVYVKMENLISTVAVPEHSYIGELIVGGQVGYRVHPNVEPVLRLWANVPFAGNDEGASLVVEPQVRFHVGSVTPLIGAILPLVGPLTDPQFAGIRVAVAGKF